MNTFGRSLLNVISKTKCINGLKKPARSGSLNFVVGRLGLVTETSRNFTRSLSVLCKKQDSLEGLFVQASYGKPCSCGCNGLHTKGDKDLMEFLEEEIKAEKKAHKSSNLTKIDDFNIKTDGSDVTLTKKFNDENIIVKLNVNHSVDAEESQDINPNQDKEPEMGGMKSKPNFNVEVEKGGKTLALTCTYSSDLPTEDQTDDTYSDSFQITEICMYDGDFKDSTYAVSGDIMDGYLYDLLMNFLEERGVSNEFADKLSEYCSSFEHSLYIDLLQGLRSFVGGK